MSRMQQTTALRGEPTTVPRPRPGRPDASLLDVEEQVARVADLVLRLAALAERYEDAMGRLAASDLVEQQARVDALRSVVERGRRHLTALGRG
jgi:hypothetical protein